MRIFEEKAKAVICGLMLASACHGPTYPDPAPPAEPLVVTPTRLSLVVSPGELPVGGGTARIFIEATGQGFLGAAGQRVTLSSTGGRLETGEAVTDKTGHASVAWSGERTATIKARVGELTASTEVRVLEPQTFPPPPPPSRTPRPTPPPPTPGPTEPPLPVVTVTPSSRTVPATVAMTLTANVSNLAAGETVLAYQWDFDSSTASTDAITVAPSVDHAFATIGVYTVKVTARTSHGRAPSGTAQIIVTN